MAVAAGGPPPLARPPAVLTALSSLSHSLSTSSHRRERGKLVREEHEAVRER